MLRLPSLRPCLVAALVAVPALAFAADRIQVSSSGSALAGRVAEAVRGADLAPSASIKVTESKGVIVLSGSTATVAARDRAARAAEGVSGVRFQEVRLGVVPTRRVDDSTLTSEVQDSVRSVQDYRAPDAVNLTAIVQRGVATLSGAVQWAEDKYRAETAAGSVNGVVRVANDIRVDPQVGSRPITIVVIPELPADIKDVSLSPDGRTVTVNGVAYAVVASRAGTLSSHDTLPPGAVVHDRLMLVTPATAP